MMGYCWIWWDILGYDKFRVYVREWGCGGMWWDMEGSGRMWWDLVGHGRRKLFFDPQERMGSKTSFLLDSKIRFLG